MPMLDFPIAQLKKDGADEVLKILKERRKAICEFVLKILNSFRILDVINFSILYI